MNGFLLVHKPPGPTSHDIVERVRRISGEKKVGHAGTLDPFAEGLLIILVGEYTKKSAEFMKLPKVYRATLRLGVVSDTDDIEGKIVEKEVGEEPLREKVEKALEAFRGEIMQVPPQYSAIKIKGKRAYKEARAGRSVLLEARKVNITKLEIIEYRYPVLILDTEVSSGTYIRSLSRDIGEALGTGAILTSLCRERVGKYILKNAITL